MKKEHLAKYAKKTIASLAIFLMMCSYFPAISCIVLAVTENQENVNNVEEGVAKQEENKTEVQNELKQESKTEAQNEVTQENEVQEETQVNQSTQQEQTELIQAQSEDSDVVIKDNKLKSYLVNDYDTNKDGKLTESEILQIKEFHIYYDVNDLSGLEAATNIESLTLSNNDYENMEAIYSLPKLIKLQLNERSISKLPNFKNVSNLESLSLYNYNQHNCTKFLLKSQIYVNYFYLKYRKSI